MQVALKAQQFLRWWIWPWLVLGAFAEVESDCPSEKSRCPGRVIVVGAGLAGLVAAQSLRRAQCDVLVLEAHQHVGGRASPIHHGPFKGFQQGAQWIHGGEQNLVMMAPLGFYNMSTIRVGGNTEFEGDDHKHHLHNDAINGSLKSKAIESFEAAKEFFEDKAVEISGSAVQDVSVRDVWASVLAKTSRFEAELLEWQIRVRSEQSWAVAPEQVGLRLAEIATYNEFDANVPDGGDSLLGSGGFSQLLQKLSEGLDIHLGAEVKSISFNDEVGEVQTTQNLSYQGSAVIVTTPLAILQAERLEFHPKMSPEWHDALHRFQMGRLAKIFVRFLPGRCPVGEDTYLLSKLVSRDSRKLLYYCIREKEVDRVTLICLVGGPSSEAAHRSSKSQLYADVVAELQEMYPSISPRDVDEVYFASFAEDPFVLGSWTSGKVGSSSSDFDIFAPTRQGLFFVGEHTCRLMYGTAQAAIVSGARAAQQAMRPVDPGAPELQSKDWPFFDEKLYSLCDELAPSKHEELRGDSCDKVWQRLAYQVPSFFQNWSGMPSTTKTCWEGLGWTEHSWGGHGRLPQSSRKEWRKLNRKEQSSASCVGYRKDLWNALVDDFPDLVICRSGSLHFRLPWDCLQPEMKKDWIELGIKRWMLDEGVPSPLAATSFDQLSTKHVTYRLSGLVMVMPSGFC